MANISMQMRKHNGEDWDNIYPVSLAENILFDDGESIQQKLNNGTLGSNEDVTLSEELKILQEQVTTNTNNIANHDHNNTYYTEIEIDSLLDNKANIDHGTHLELGTTSSTAFRGDYGDLAFIHSQEAHAPVDAQKNSDITKAEIEAKLTGNITSHTHDGIGGDYLPIAGGTLTGPLVGTSIRPSTTSTYSLGLADYAYDAVIANNFALYDSNGLNNGGLRLYTTGTSSTVGDSRLTLGNSTKSGTAGNSKGKIIMYGSSSGYSTIQPGYNSTSNITLTLPSSTGTIALTSQIPSVPDLSDVGQGYCSKAQTGYTYLPNDVLIQWGKTVAPGGTTGKITFPISFPSTVGSVTAVVHRGDSVSHILNLTTSTSTKNGFSWYANPAVGAGMAIMWMAIGY